MCGGKLTGWIGRLQHIFKYFNMYIFYDYGNFLKNDPWISLNIVIIKLLYKLLSLLK